MSISANLRAAYGAFAQVSRNQPVAQTPSTSDAAATLLRKTQTSQQSAAAQLLEQLGGKGQHLDIRV